MRVIVFGSKNWSNYGDIMRNMTILLEDIKYSEQDIKKLTLVHTGGLGAENMVTEYVGKVEKFLRQKGLSIKEELVRIPAGESRSIIDYNIVAGGADYALVFTTKNDKRMDYCLKMLEEFEIPTKIVNE